MINKLPNPIDVSVSFRADPSMRTHLRFDNKISVFIEVHYGEEEGEGKGDTLIEIMQNGESKERWNIPLEECIWYLHRVVEELLKVEL